MEIKLIKNKINLGRWKKALEHRKAFTIVETLVYSVSLSFLMVTSLYTGINLLENNDQVDDIVTMEEEANFVIKKIEWALTDNYDTYNNNFSLVGDTTSPEDPSSSGAQNLLVDDTQDIGFDSDNNPSTPPDDLTTGVIDVDSVTPIYDAGSAEKPASTDISFTLGIGDDTRSYNLKFYKKE